MHLGTAKSASEWSGTLFVPGRPDRACAVCLVLVLLGPALPGCRDELPAKSLQSSEAKVATSQPPPASAPPQTLAGKRVLLVHSYHPGYPWVDSVSQGIADTLRDAGLDLQIIYMDTKRHTDEAWKTNAGSRAKKKVEEYRPDVLLTCDDDAQQYFARAYVNTPIPIVFTGVDADPSKYGFPATNVTGVIERPHFVESLALAGTLRPIRRVAVISGNDSTSVAAIGFMKQEKLDVEVTEWLLAADFDEWKQAIGRFNTTVDALVIRSYQAVKRPGTQENVEPREVADWIVANATIPTIAFHDFEIKDGVLVGVVKSGQEYGRQAAQYALQILSGTPAGTLPIVKTKLGIRMVNRTTARRRGILLTDGLLKDVTTVSEN